MKEIVDSYLLEQRLEEFTPIILSAIIQADPKMTVADSKHQAHQVALAILYAEKLSEAIDKAIESYKYDTEALDWKDTQEKSECKED